MSLSNLLTSRTLYAAIQEFLTEKRIEQASKKTIRFYRDNLMPFVDLVDGKSEVSKITPDQVREFLLLSQQRKGVYGHHARYRSLRTFFNWCVREHYCLETPLRVKPPKLPNRIMPRFEQHEIVAVLDACGGNTGLRDRAIILTFLDTGLRLEEMATTRLQDVDIQVRRIRVMGKGQKAREVSFSPTTAKAIWRYVKATRAEHDSLWLSEEQKPLTTSGVQQIVRRVTTKALGKVAGPHKFRHTFACNYIEAGGDSLDLQRLLGHSSLWMVKRYTEAVRAETAVRSQQRFSPVERMNLR